MAISSLCPNGHSFSVRDDLVGKKVRCPQCSAVSVVGGTAAAGAKPAAKKKAAGEDPWDLDDPFDGEEASPKKSAGAPARSSAPAKAGSRKKRSSKSGGNSFPIVPLIGGLAGVAVLGGGVWFWLGRQPGPVEAPPVAAVPAGPTTPTAPSPMPGTPPAAAATSPSPEAPTVATLPPGSPTSPPAVIPMGGVPKAKVRPVPPPNIPAADAEIAKEVAGYPFPPTTDPAYGPAAPEGLVVSRAMVNAAAEMVIGFTRAKNSQPAPPEVIVQNVVANVAKQRQEDPQMYCLSPTLEEGLLAGTADHAAARQDFEATLTSLGTSDAELSLTVVTQMGAYQQNQLSTSRIVFLAEMLKAKIRGAKRGPAKTTADAPASGTPDPPPIAFLDQTKQVPPGLEWNRQIMLRKAGGIRLRVTSTQKFSVLIVTDKAFQGIEKNQLNKVTKADLLFDADPRTEPLEQIVELPAVSCWIMIKNESKTAAETHVECFPG